MNEKRFTTSAPFTLSTAWTWNTRGSAKTPYNLLWIHDGNAQLGMVQTSLLATHDAANGGDSDGGASHGSLSAASRLTARYFLLIPTIWRALTPPPA